MIARRHVEAALESGESDLVAENAARLPTDVISELVGAPEADRAEVRRPADTAMHREPETREIGPEGIAALLELVGHFAEIIADRRRRRRDDLASALLDTAAPTQLRTLTEDIELHGVAPPAGARIVLLPGAANRDPRIPPDVGHTTLITTR